MINVYKGNQKYGSLIHGKIKSNKAEDKSLLTHSKMAISIWMMFISEVNFKNQINTLQHNNELLS